MTSEEPKKDLTETVAKHYNELQEGGLEERGQSRIFYQRNFNNWIKSMEIADIVAKVRRQNGSKTKLTVLDLCAGKGGDILKWKKAEIDHLVCADIAEVSVKQCEVRYKEMIERSKGERNPTPPFTAEFITADCTKQRLKDLYKNSDIKFDIVSCQFSFHYGFESLSQAEMMLQNACECLKPGGFFIGTTLDSYEIVKRLRSSEGNLFGNEVYRITFESNDIQNIPLFGAKYDFHLEGVVSCPEFLVYFPLLEKMAEAYNMKLLFRTPFSEFYKEHVLTREGRGLIGRMSALEAYPAEADVGLMSKDEVSYEHAKQFLEKLKERNEAERGSRKEMKVGTLSQPEWQASTVYLVFGFQRTPDGAVSDESRKRKSERPIDEITEKVAKKDDVTSD